jgi:hypothetical protein
MEWAPAVAFLALLLLCLVLAALCLAGGRGRGPRAPPAGGAPPARPPRRGPDPARSPHLVVDTLNLTHWLRGPAALTPETIVETINEAAPTLKRRHPGNLIFVVKDRESQFNSDATRNLFKEAAERNKVTVAITERYLDPPAGAKPSAEHSARGRDDFYTSVLAFRLRCAVLTADRLRDFEEFRATVRPFHTIEYAFWRAQPHREYIRPDSRAYARLRRPATIDPSEYFSAAAREGAA